MEDSVGEEERREQGEAMVQAVKKDEQVVAGGGGGEPGEEGGLLSAMASKIGAAMVGGNENRGVNGGTVNATAASSGEEEKKGDGHGGGGIFQKFMSSSHAPSPDSRVPGTEEVKGEGKAQDAGGEQGGILSSMASRIGMTMSSANDNGDHSTAGDAIDNVKGEDQDKGDEANGGILSAMASKIGMAMSGANGDGNRGGSGVDARTSNGDAAAGSKVEEKGGEANGGGLVDQIMSNLPSDDHAPEADEVSLLIAIIED